MSNNAAAAHLLPVRVYYEDTDAAGIVYHANYLKFAERARTEFMRELGLDHGTLRRRYGLVFAVARCVVDFLAPARLDDCLTVATRVLKLSGVRLRLEQTVRREDAVLARIEVTLVLLGADDLRPKRGALEPLQRLLHEAEDRA